jgi:hypothetical protein
MRAGLAALARHPAAVLRVDHGELAAAPRAVLTRVLAFAALARDERVLAYAERTARPPAKAPPLELAPCLAAPFEATRRALWPASGLPGG